jgi:tRNA(Arg) A34 adenosine deaminase TadA
MEDRELAVRRDGLSRRNVAALALGALALPIVRPAFGRGIEGPATAADEKFMRLALEEAALGDDPYYFGAVIVRGGEALARGRNLWNQLQDPTAHAEMVAIKRFLSEYGIDEIKGTTLYCNGESCPMCMGAIIWCGISRVVFGASIAQLATKFGQIMITDADIADKTPFADVALTGGVLAEESLKLFK